LSRSRESEEKGTQGLGLLYWWILPNGSARAIGTLKFKGELKSPAMKLAPKSNPRISDFVYFELTDGRQEDDSRMAETVEQVCKLRVPQATFTQW